MTEDILERAKALRSSAFGTHKQALDVVDELIADIERLRSLENCVSLVIDRQGKTNAALLGQLDVISAYLDTEMAEWKNGDQIAEIAIKFMDRQKQNLNDANSQIAAKNDKIAQDAITIQMHHNNVLTLQKEVERLRSENRELKKTDVWANDVIKEHESLNARINGLEATKERLQSAPKSGLYGKYIIQKADGSPVDPEADYFILRLDADPVARIAALEYAIQTDDQKLGEMLEKRVMDHVFSKDDQCRKRVEGWPIGQIKQLREQIASKDARIKELEAEITAWIADRDSWIARYEAVREEAPREMAELMAREALEIIKEGGKDE